MGPSARGLGALGSAPAGGLEPPTKRLRTTPRFPSGTDYLFAMAPFRL